jgi:hypothetical protein
MFTGLDIMAQGALNMAIRAAGSWEIERTRSAPSGSRPPRAREHSLTRSESRLAEWRGRERAETSESIFRRGWTVEREPDEPVAARPSAAEREPDEPVAARPSAAEPKPEDRERALAIARLIPKRPYRFHSVVYENPLTVEIISEAGLAATTLAFLLRLARDWSSIRRSSAAAAADAESRAFLRAMLTRVALEKIASGELQLTAEMVNELLSEKMAGAVDRLAVHGPAVDQQSIPGE